MRSLVGLEREAAKDAFTEFMAFKNLNGIQMEFSNLIIEHFAERHAIDPRRMQESLLTDLDDLCVISVIPQSDVSRVIFVSNDLRARSNL
jgi:type I restriction enzyme R subunit